MIIVISGPLPVKLTIKNLPEQNLLHQTMRFEILGGVLGNQEFHIEEA